MNFSLKNLMRVVLIGSGLALASASAQAQLVSIGQTGLVNVGGLKAGHADQLTAGVQDGQIVASGGVADGVAIPGVGKVKTGLEGAIAAPLPKLPKLPKF
jgi:hypothetical protein